jgi:hypothetical protein
VVARLELREGEEQQEEVAETGVAARCYTVQVVELGVAVLQQAVAALEAAVAEASTAAARRLARH